MTHPVDDYEYSAFISYRHLATDRKWATWLLTALETYRTPKPLQRDGVPSKLGKAFRDEDEIPASSDLSSEIKTALEKSQFLIVICSKETPASSWIAEEIRTFHALGRSDRIIALLVDGEPGDAFPELLLKVPESVSEDGEIVWSDEVREPIAADVRPRDDTSDRVLKHSALLRIAASILGVRFDDLKRRETERRRRKMRTVATTCLFAVALSTGLIWYALDQRQAAHERFLQTQIEQTRFLINAAQAYVQDGKYADAVALLLEGLPRSATFDDRPLDPKALELMNTASLLNRERSVIRIPGKAISDAAFDPKGGHLITGATDYKSEISTSGIWDLNTGKPVTRLAGHTDMIASSAINFENQIAVTGSVDKTARIWKLSDGSQIGEPISHGDTVWRVAITPDGKYVATAARDSTAKISRVSDGETIAVLHGHTGAVSDIVFSPDSKRILTGSGDKTARLWSVPEGELQMIFKGHTDVITSVDFSPTNDAVVTGSHDETARLWDLGNSESSAVLTGHTDSVIEVEFSPSGRVVFTGSRDNTGRLWSVKSGDTIVELKGHTGDVTSVAFSPNAPHLVTGSDDGTARLWGATDKPAIAVLNGHDEDIRDVGFSADGALIATASSDASVRTWHAGRSAASKEFRPYAAVATRLAISHSGTQLAVGSADGSIRILATDDLTETTTWYGHKGIVLSLAFSSDGRWLLTGAENGEAKLWDVETGKLVYQLEGHVGDVTLAAISPDGAFLATSSVAKSALIDGKLTLVGPPSTRIWNRATAEEVRLLTDETVTGLAFTADSKSIWTAAGASSMLVLRKVDDGSELKRMGPYPDAIISMRLSHKGDKLALGYVASEPKVIGLDGTQSDFSLPEFGSTILKLSFSTDGARLVTVADGKPPVLWQLDARMATARYSGLKAATDAVFTADGQHLIFVDTTGNVSKWPTVDGISTSIAKNRNYVEATDPLSKKQKCDHFIVDRESCQNGSLTNGN